MLAIAILCITFFIEIDLKGDFIVSDSEWEESRTLLRLDVGDRHPLHNLA
jgi:hypothetical protein